MELREWQRKNFESLKGRFVPRDAHELFLISASRLYGNLPINPWLDFLEVLALGWRASFLAKDDIVTFWETIQPQRNALLIPSEEELGQKHRRILRLALDVDRKSTRL